MDDEQQWLAMNKNGGAGAAAAAPVATVTSVNDRGGGAGNPRVQTATTDLHGTVTAGGVGHHVHSSLASAVFGNTLAPPVPSAAAGSGGTTPSPSSSMTIHYSRRRSSPCTQQPHQQVESVAIISKGEHHGQLLPVYGADTFFDTISCGGRGEGTTQPNPGIHLYEVPKKHSHVVTKGQTSNPSCLLANGPLAVEGEKIHMCLNLTFCKKLKSDSNR